MISAMVEELELKWFLDYAYIDMRTSELQMRKAMSANGRETRVEVDKRVY
jgi:hypothetical protein